VHTSADIHGYRIAVGSVAPMPVRLRFLESLLGRTQTCDFGTLDRATAMPEIAPVDDLRGTACYRRHLVAELAQQAIELAELRS
jgi:CO/xanthine dehydrogenase FAD-binding subunit